MESKSHTNTSKNDLWSSDQILDIIFDSHWKEFVEFAEDCLQADIAFIEDECMYEVKKWNRCKCGGEYRTDGMHQNVFCSLCYKDKPKWTME